MCADIKENEKTFWQYVKAKNMKPIKDPEGIVHYDDIGKANLLNEYFTSVFTVDTAFEEYATLIWYWINIFNSKRYLTTN